jgi:hypothetical protein
MQRNSPFFVVLLTTLSFGFLTTPVVDSFLPSSSTSLFLQSTIITPKKKKQQQFVISLLPLTHARPSQPKELRDSLNN